MAGLSPQSRLVRLVTIPSVSGGRDWTGEPITTLLDLGRPHSASGSVSRDETAEANCTCQTRRDQDDYGDGA
jgi:hypothetical protein